MGSQDKFFSITAAPHGIDDIGLAQPSGTISARADAKVASAIYGGKLLLTVDSTAALKKGMPVRIAGLDSGHNGLTRILAIVSATAMIVNITFNSGLADGTGTWQVDGGAGAWDAFVPIGDDIAAGNLALTMWDTNKVGADLDAVAYTKDVIYAVPGIIKTAQVSTAGNVRLIRAASLRPFGKDAQ